MKKLLLILALSMPLMGHAQSSSQAAALRTQIASESVALEAKVAVDPVHSIMHDRILQRKKRLKAVSDPVEINATQTAVRNASYILEMYVAKDPKYKDAYAHIDTLVDQLKKADPSDNTQRHHYVANQEPK